MSKKKRNNNYTGKKFEEDFRNSISNELYVHRLKDNAHNWAKVTNICDFFLYKRPILYMMELKTTKAQSLPFSNIAQHQIEGLDLQSTLHNGVLGGFLVNFSKPEQTYFIHATPLKQYIDSNTFIFTESNGEEGRKSIPIQWFKDNGIRVINNKKRTRFNYDIDNLIRQLLLLEHIKEKG